MSSINPTSTSLDTSHLVLPAGVKLDTPEQKQLYASALEFERYFVQQMLKPMEDAGSMLGGKDEGGDSAMGTGGMSGYKDMAQDQMTQSILDGGGLGMASTLYQQMADQLGLQTKAAPALKPTDAKGAAS